jgi:major membrane immunogen (membrane-anchored lipoprotein)
MKNLMTLVIVAFIFISCNNQRYFKKDGTFFGHSQSKYKDEPFIGYSKVTIVHGKIKQIDFRIIDTSKNEIFDSLYEKHFIGNQEYINQCRNDWNGVKNYPAKLILTQNLNRVDAVSGATWSYNMFKCSAQIALKEADK